MGADMTAVKAALREHYNNKTIVDIVYTSTKDVNPGLAAMEAIADTGEGMGRLLITQIVYGTGTSVGQNFANVLAKAQGSSVGSSGLYGRWETLPATIEGVARWDRATMDAAMGRSSGETFKVMTKEMDLKMVAMRRLLATYSFGDGTGSLAQITALDSSSITVAIDVVNRFQRGHDIVTSTTTTGAIKNPNTTTPLPNLGVTGVDYSAGKVYLDADPTSTAGGRTAWAVNDYVFLFNDRPLTALSDYTKYVLPYGLKSWLPGPSVTDSTTWNGQTRNGITELAGLTCDCSSLEPEDGFLKALTLLFNTSGVKASALFCNPYDYMYFISQKDKSKSVQINVGKYELGFDAFNVKSLAGDVPVVPDAFCPAGEFYAGPWNDNELAPRLVYVGDLVQIDNKDGMDFIRSASATAYEMRLYSRLNIVMPAPGRFVRGFGLSVS